MIPPSIGPLEQYAKNHATPKDVLHLAKFHANATLENLSASSREHSPGNINMTSKSPVGDISNVTLIRADTTIDHRSLINKVQLASDMKLLTTTDDCTSRVWKSVVGERQQICVRLSDSSKLSACKASLA